MCFLYFLNRVKHETMNDIFIITVRNEAFGQRAVDPGSMHSTCILRKAVQ